MMENMKIKFNSDDESPLIKAMIIVVRAIFDENDIKVIYFDRIDVSEGNDVNEASKPKECGICHYWYFLNKWFTFQLYACNRYYD